MGREEAEETEESNKMPSEVRIGDRPHRQFGFHLAIHYKVYVCVCGCIAGVCVFGCIGGVCVCVCVCVYAEQECVCVCLCVFVQSWSVCVWMQSRIVCVCVYAEQVCVCVTICMMS